ncbi:MAG: hypothetical protein ACYSWW_20410 [Planctomycetota bacterium]
MSSKKATASRFPRIQPRVFPGLVKSPHRGKLSERTHHINTRFRAGDSSPGRQPQHLWQV